MDKVAQPAAFMAAKAGLKNESTLNRAMDILARARDRRMQAVQFTNTPKANYRAIAAQQALSNISHYKLNQILGR